MAVYRVCVYLLICLHLFCEPAQAHNAQETDQVEAVLREAKALVAHDQKAEALEKLRPYLDQEWPKDNLRLQKALASLTLLADKLQIDSVDYDRFVPRLNRVRQYFESYEPESENLACTYLNLGIRAWFSEKYAEAEEWWKKGYGHAKGHGYKRLEIKTLHRLGYVYTRNRDMSYVKSHYRYLLSVIRNFRKASTAEDEVLALNALGNAYNLEHQPDSAIHYLSKAYRLVKLRNRQQRPVDNWQKHLAMISHNLGNVYVSKEACKTAIPFLEESLELNTLVYGPNSTYLLRSLKYAGKAYTTLGQPGKAQQLLLRALEISKAQNFDITRTYVRMGEFYDEIGELATANIYYDSALAINGIHFAKADNKRIPALDFLTIMISKSRFIANSDSTDVYGLEALYQRLIENCKELYVKSDAQALFIHLPGIFEDLYHAYTGLYYQTGEDRWMDRLWDIMEMNKAVKLRHRLVDDSSLKVIVPENILKKEAELKAAINHRLGKIIPDQFDSTLFLLNRKYDQFLHSLEDQYPEYYKLKHTFKTTSLRETLALNQANELSMNFFQGEKNIYLIYLISGEAHLKRIPKETLSKAINRHNESIINTTMAETTQSSAAIIDLLGLDESVLTQVNRIRVIPDGIIWDLNFASLTVLMNEEHVFLGNSHVLSFDYFADAEPYAETSNSDKILAFSFGGGNDANSFQVVRSDGSRFTEIPGTTKEIEAISDIWEGRFSHRSQASETAFKNESGHSDILHLAVHGYLNEERPENSYLQFARADSMNDGRLHAYEIYNLDISAELAVLSACHSGNGQIVAGEGMMSLGRSFAYAGVKSLLVSRWEVSDFSAPYLMKYFYEGLKEGMYKSEALQYAQKKYLENHSDALTASPFYWSSFYILGDDSPIYHTSVYDSYLISAILALVLLSGYQRFRKKGKGKPARVASSVLRTA